MNRATEGRGESNRCAACGQQNAAFAIHCQRCGVALRASQPPTIPNRPVDRNAAVRPPSDQNIFVKPQPSHEKRCPGCGVRYRPGIMFCERCGTNVETGKPDSLSTVPVSSQRLQDYDRLFDALEPQTQKMSKDAIRRTSTNIVRFSTDSLLCIEIEGFAVPLVLSIQKNAPCIVGRGHPSLKQVQVDLTPYNGHSKGISRQHAAFVRQGNSLYLWDLGSTNGTYLNGNQLVPGQKHQLRNGDKIRLGQLEFTILFQDAPSM